MNKKPQPQQKRAPSTPEKKQEARARRWRRTGVSASTVEWMRANHML